MNQTNAQKYYTSSWLGVLLVWTCRHVHAAQDGQPVPPWRDCDAHVHRGLWKALTAGRGTFTDVDGNRGKCTQRKDLRGRKPVLSGRPEARWFVLETD